MGNIRKSQENTYDDDKTFGLKQRESVFNSMTKKDTLWTWEKVWLVHDEKEK